MILETEEQFRKRSREAERTRESRESKESEVDEETKAGAAMERADFIVKEVKQSKQQMQNIVVHMQQVKTAIRQLRQQLQLADKNEPISIEQNKKRIEELKLKIKDYQGELVKMREDLIREQVEELKAGADAGMSVEGLRAKAEEMVEELISVVKK